MMRLKLMKKSCFVCSADQIRNNFNRFKTNICNIFPLFFFPACSAVHDFRCAQILHSGARIDWSSRNDDEATL